MRRPGVSDSGWTFGVTGRAAGLDALAHAVEGYVSRFENPFAYLQAEQATRVLVFAERATLRGAERFPDIGRMTHFQSPWDRSFVMDRMVRWVSLGGPL
jgi:hypothetical protein